MTLSGSENGRVTVSYYDSFWRECDYDRNKKKRNVVRVFSYSIQDNFKTFYNFGLIFSKINIGKLKINENFEPVPFAKKDEDITPFPEGEEPQVTFVFCRDRVSLIFLRVFRRLNSRVYDLIMCFRFIFQSQGSQEVEPSRQEVENVYRFYRFTRVNKVITLIITRILITTFDLCIPPF